MNNGHVFLEHSSHDCFKVALLHHYRDCSGLHSGFADMGPAVLSNKRRSDKSVQRYEHLVTQSPVHKLVQTLR